jgi:uncharacterized membrane protein
VPGVEYIGMTSLIGFIATLIALSGLDALWILVIAKGFYADRMGFLFTKTPNLVPAAVFYPLYSLGVLFLAVLPAFSTGSWVEAIWRGALLGIAAYGAYDLSNHATIAKWPLSVTLTDMAWGTVVTALTSVIAYLVLAAIR